MTDEELAEPSDARARMIVDRYIAAFEQSDMGAVERLLADDAILEMTGTTTWFSGKTTCLPFIATGHRQLRRLRMLPVRANGQLAVAAYHLGADDVYQPLTIVVLATSLTHLTRISLLAQPALFSRFDVPAAISD